jgi:dynein heavy chain
LEKFAQKKPSFILYDEKLTFYSKLAKDVDSQATSNNIDFVYVSSSSLQQSIHAEAISWINSIGKLLNDMARQGYVALDEKFNKFNDDLRKVPSALEELTALLNVIANVKDISEDVEMKYRDVLESYRTLKIYNIEIDTAEYARALELPERWRALLKSSVNVDNDMIPIKAKFTDSTCAQVQDLKREIKDFLASFISNGPRNADKDLDAGLDQLNKAKALLNSFQTRRENLVAAEKLFNLNISSYPEIYELESEINSLQHIYDLYSDVTKAVQTWSKSLWSNLDINMMTKSVENFVIRLKKLPKELKQLPPYNIVASKINSFKDSIPLYSDLKNEALRDRHWKKLMEITGRSFDMNPDTFTLEKLFSMNLHTHSEAIQEIVGAAIKELNIENGLKEIENTWKNLRFTVAKYMKGTEDRGYILGAIDEITSLLDDNAMNLQSMSASKFAVPFLPLVQKWEKTLSHIGEITDVWMVVQRKWMYLESIFIGSGDIRMQLPDEAARFDRIDKSFKKIMNETAKNNAVLEACSTEGRLGQLQELSDELEACQKSLSDYLESKRNAFARFFFISDDELLSILGSHDPKNIQEHIIKMFDNVLKLTYGTGRNEKAVCGMSSTEGEVLEFRTPRANSRKSRRMDD